jgi:ribosome assembly protein YihI (activator of Der GTPase)
MAKKSLPVEKLKATSKKPIPVKIVSEVGESKSHEAREKKWQAEDDLRTLQRAKEVESDKARMKAAKALAQEQMNNLKKCM